MMSIAQPVTAVPAIIWIGMSGACRPIRRRRAANGRMSSSVNTGLSDCAHAAGAVQSPMVRSMRRSE